MHSLSSSKHDPHPCWNLVVKYDFPIHLLAVGCFLCKLGVMARYFIPLWWFKALSSRLCHDMPLSPLLACLFPGEDALSICLGFFLTTCTANAYERGADIGTFAASSKWSNARCKFQHICKWNNLLFIGPHFIQLLPFWKTRRKITFASPDPRVVFQVSVESESFGGMTPSMCSLHLRLPNSFCLLDIVFV